MRALALGDAGFLSEMTRTLIDRSPPNYFRFWYSLFTARHSHRGERLFRTELAALRDDHAVKYRRWLRKIFRRLRFRCDTPREKAIGAVVFSLQKQYLSDGYRSDVFDAFFEAHRVATSELKSKTGKVLSGERRAERFAEAAASLGIWSIAEGIRTSARVPRTLHYLSTMAPRMTDTEVRRALRAFDGYLGAADHKKAPEAVVACADYLRTRLSTMNVPLGEWAKILPYAQSPPLTRVLEELVGVRLQATVAWASEVAPFTAVPVLDTQLDARAFRTAFVLSYALQQSRGDSNALVIDPVGSLRVLAHASPLWPYGVCIDPPAARWEADPDHRYRIGFSALREMFPLVAKRQNAEGRSLAYVQRALRWHLWQRATVDGGCVEHDVPVIFLTEPPSVDERNALAAHLDCFSAAVLVLFETPWHNRTLARAHVHHCTVPRDLAEATDVITDALRKVPELQQGFAARREGVSREVRRLALAPQPPVIYWGRATPR
jgi:hypothetical protein